MPKISYGEPTQVIDTTIRLQAMPAAPQSWKRVPLRYLTRSIGGGTPAKEKPEFWVGDIPWVSPKDMKSGQIYDSEDHINELALAESTTQFVNPESVLIVCRSGILKHTIPVAINKVAVTLNQDMKALVVRNDCLPEFLKYAIEGNQSRLLALWRKAGATVESLEFEDMANTSFALPPLTLQRSIVKIVDQETAIIDEMMQEKEALLELLGERNAALLSEAVSVGLNPAVVMKPSGIEWTEKIPKQWSVMKVAHVAQRIGSGTTPPSGEHEWYEDGTVPWVTTSELRETQIFTTEKFVTQAALDQFSALAIFPPDSVLIAMYGATIGRLGVLKAHATMNQACCAIECGERITPDFLFRVLQAAKQHLINQSSGGGQPNISQEKVASLRIPLPPLEEQRAITDYLIEEDHRFESAASLILKGVEQLKRRRASLINDAVSGL